MVINIILLSFFCFFVFKSQKLSILFAVSKNVLYRELISLMIVLVFMFSCLNSFLSVLGKVGSIGLLFHVSFSTSFLFSSGFSQIEIISQTFIYILSHFVQFFSISISVILSQTFLYFHVNTQFSFEL